MDHLLNNNISVNELTSALFQSIVTLDIYQHAFDFTHNDLHTNNIMYCSTELEYIYYKIKGKLYKVPTFGKIYKIIDFGRSIYTYNNTRICSDSFSSNGTAHGQYNCEPFFNKNKPRLEPNKSFDLCRLACSLIDYLTDNNEDLDIYRLIPTYSMIIEWLNDDNGVSVLYKPNGHERYADFKLYKMIAKTVNNHVPKDQYSNVCFNEYICEDVVSVDYIIDVDMLCETIY